MIMWIIIRIIKLLLIIKNPFAIISLQITHLFMIKQFQSLLIISNIKKNINDRKIPNS